MCFQGSLMWHSEMNNVFSGGHYCEEAGLTGPTGKCDSGYFCTTGVNSKTPSFSSTGLSYRPRGMKTIIKCTQLYIENEIHSRLRGFNIQCISGKDSNVVFKLYGLSCWNAVIFDQNLHIWRYLNSAICVNFRCWTYLSYESFPWFSLKF